MKVVFLIGADTDWRERVAAQLANVGCLRYLPDTDFLYPEIWDEFPIRIKGVEFDLFGLGQYNGVLVVASADSLSDHHMAFLGAVSWELSRYDHDVHWFELTDRTFAPNANKRDVWGKVSSFFRPGLWSMQCLGANEQTHPQKADHIENVVKTRHIIESDGVNEVQVAQTIWQKIENMGSEGGKPWT